MSANFEGTESVGGEAAPLEPQRRRRSLGLKAEHEVEVET